MPTQTNSSPEISLTHHMTRANGVLLHYLHVLGDSHFVMAAATATAFALMLVTHTLHSPAGSDPLIVISAKASWGILLSLALGGLFLFLGAYVFNNYWPRMKLAENQPKKFPPASSRQIPDVRVQTAVRRQPEAARRRR
jgi:CBS-domain-containing membrane protein